MATQTQVTDFITNYGKENTDTGLLTIDNKAFKMSADSSNSTFGGARLSGFENHFVISLYDG